MLESEISYIKVIERMYLANATVLAIILMAAFEAIFVPASVLPKQTCT